MSPERENKGTEIRRDQRKTNNKVVDPNPAISKVTLNGNGQNTPIKIVRMSGYNFLRAPTFILVSRNTL